MMNRSGIPALRVIALLCVFCTCAMLRAREHAVVSASAIFMLSAADYESPIETQELMGTEVEVLQTDRYWIRISTPQPYTAWTNAMGVTIMDDAAYEAWKSAPKCIVTATGGRVMSMPDVQSRQLSPLVFGDVMAVAGPVQDGWTPVCMPDGRRGWVRSGIVEERSAWLERMSSLGPQERRRQVTAFAEGLSGVPYLWGGMTPNALDCSGLTRLSYMSCGIWLPRNASQQATCGRPVELPMNADGTVDRGRLFGSHLPLWHDPLREGDILFFGRIREDGSKAVTHVALYLGKGCIIHSSQLVRINSLVPGAHDCYENAHKLLGACRIIE